jgi:hypothetical protein
MEHSVALRSEADVESKQQSQTPCRGPCGSCLPCYRPGRCGCSVLQPLSYKSRSLSPRRRDRKRDSSPSAEYTGQWRTDRRPHRQRCTHHRGRLCPSCTQPGPHSNCWHKVYDRPLNQQWYQQRGGPTKLYDFHHHPLAGGQHELSRLCAF